MTLFANVARADDAGAVATGPNLLITPHLTEEEYCRDRNGLDQIRLTVGFTYRNRGALPLIVPIVTRLSELRIEAHRLTKPIRVRYKLKAVDGVSPEIYRTQMPSPKLFWVLSPGQSQEGVPQSVALRVVENGTYAEHRILSPGEYRLEFDLNLGSRRPNDPEVSADRWVDVGILVLGKAPSESIPLNVGEPKRVRCTTPRGIL